MTYTNNKLFENHQSNCTKYEEYKSRIQQLEHDVTEKEDEYIFRYRHFEDTKGARSMDSSKSLKRRHSPLKEVKRHE
jgi:hypothetical protein